MSTYTFPTVRIEGETPDWAADGRTIGFVAPRPLYGTERKITPTGWAGEVSVNLDDPDAGRQVENNLRMDARVAVWATRAQMVAEVRDRIADEYGPDVLDSLDDDEILSMLRPPAPVSITV